MLVYMKLNVIKHLVTCTQLWFLDLLVVLLWGWMILLLVSEVQPLVKLPYGQIYAPY